MKIEKAREMLAAASLERECDHDIRRQDCASCDAWWPIAVPARGELQRLGFTPAAFAVLILAVEALEGHGLLLDCLETVCVGLPPVDREAADNFIEQIAAANRKALAAWEAL